MYIISNESTIRGLVGFGITIGWALILSPFIKRHRKSRSFLVFLAGFFSFFCVMARQSVEPEFLTDESFLQVSVYSFGILLGLIALSLRFWWKGPAKINSTPGLPTTPELKEGKDSPSFDFEPGERISLRHLFQIAIMIKNNSHNYFQMMAEKITDEETKAVCLYLATEQQAQIEPIKKQLGHWKHKQMPNENLQALADQLIAIEEFFPKPSPSDSIKHLLTLALQQEQKVIEFYRSFSRDYHKPWKVMKVNDLIMMEQKHADLLRNILSKKPGM